MGFVVPTEKVLEISLPFAGQVRFLKALLNEYAVSLYPRPSLYAFQTESAGSNPRWGRGQTSVSAHARSIETGGAAGRKISPRRHSNFELHQLRRDSHVRVDAIQFSFAQPAHRDDLSLLAVRRRFCRGPGGGVM